MPSSPLTGTDDSTNEEMVSASELREFIYCERAWWLSRQGYAVSPEASARREEGTVFHEQRARAARKAHEARAVRWAILLLLAALALVVASLLERPL